MRIWTDPDRWVDSDMQRNEWLRWARRQVLWAVAILVAVVVLLRLL